jgi:hypothetical protein
MAFSGGSTCVYYMGRDLQLVAVGWCVDLDFNLIFGSELL